MVSWIAANLATILVTALVIAVVAVVIGIMLRDKKKGKSCCGGNCSHCPMGGSCHKH